MVTLEQVKLLESKVGKAIDYVQRLSAENATLRAKLEGYRVRIDELEVLVRAFKDDQGRIEAGIISALERLNKFEDAVEHSLAGTASIDEDRDPATADLQDSGVLIPDGIEEPELDAPLEEAMEIPAVTAVDDGASEDEDPADSEEPDKVGNEKEERSTELDIF